MTETNGAALNQMASAQAGTLVEEPRSYSKLPVVIKALQWTGSNWAAMTLFCETAIPSNEHGQWLVIPTLEGDHTAKPGDFIIRGIAGEFYPCRESIFHATYQPA